MTRYFLCDQSLRSLSGHCYGYFAAVANVLADRGKPAVVVGHRDRDLPIANLGVVGGFTLLCDEQNVPKASQSGSDVDSIRSVHEETIQRDLEALNQRFAFSSNDKIVFNTVHQWVIRGIVEWLERLVPERRPSVAFIFHFTSQPQQFRWSAIHRLYREALQRIEGSSCRRRMRLYADTDSLVREYQAMTTLEVELLPIPHALFPQVPSVVKQGSRRLSIGYIGEARFHKGFHLLPFIVRSLAESRFAGDVEFHFQSFIFDRDADFYKKSMAHLRESALVTLYPDALDADRYQRLLQACDLVLLPYSLDYYHTQSSGVFADAVGMGLPVVVSRGTWMARMLRMLGSGEMCNSGDYLGFAAATQKVCSDIARYQAAARQARVTWARFHSPANFVNILDR